VASDRNDELLAAPGGLELVRDFVNTLDILPGTDKFGDPAGLALWLADNRLVPSSPVLTDGDLARARRLREALRAFLLANAGLPLDPGAAAAFDDAAGPARLRARPDEEGWLELLPVGEVGLGHAIGRLVSIVFAAQQDGTWSRLKACAECHWALYDHTKNYSASWCGSQCGARVRSRRYRQRRHGSPPYSELQKD
jgi:predicted RNA-binding Zn ribbon-like protein